MFVIYHWSITIKTIDKQILTDFFGHLYRSESI